MREDLQTAFFKIIKEKIGPNISLVDEVADALSISKDSAYRRLRGETSLDLPEIQKLTQAFKLSLDAVLSLNSDSVNFSTRMVDNKENPFGKYFSSLLDTLRMISHFEDNHLLYGAKDIPIFHYFQFDELGKFKIFFWLKTYLHYEKYQKENFDLDLIDDQLLETGRRIWMGYMKIPSTEIWSYETVNLMLSQINFYFESGVIGEAMAIRLLDQYSELLEHIRSECANGCKYHYGSDAVREGAGYKIYLNEVSSPDNNVFFRMGDSRMVMITYNTLNILSTSNKVFCDQAEHYYTNILAKSELLSGTSEKRRNKFFNRLQKKIKSAKEKIRSSIVT